MLIPGQSISLETLHSIESNYKAVHRVLERFATGKQINRASDDPSGLSAANGLRSANAGLEAELKALERIDAVANTADGAMAEMSDLLSRADALGVEYANEAGLSDAERDAIAIELNSIAEGVNRILSTTSFNGDALFDDDLRLNANGETLSLDQLSLSFEGAATVEEKVSHLSSFRDQVIGGRAQIGAFSRHVVGSQSRSIGESIEQLTTAESMIRDTDHAKEAGALARTEVLAEASVRSLDFLNDDMGLLLQLINPRK